jgi:hypothetical protein
MVVVRERRAGNQNGRRIPEMWFEDRPYLVGISLREIRLVDEREPNRFDTEFFRGGAVFVPRRWSQLDGRVASVGSPAKRVTTRRTTPSRPSRCIVPPIDMIASSRCGDSTTRWLMTRPSRISLTDRLPG